MDNHLPFNVDERSMPMRYALSPLLHSWLRSLGMLALVISMAACGSAKPTIAVPTPDCGAPTLAIGSSTFRIQTLEPQADGSIKLPLDTNGVAYWVSGTSSNQVFLIGAAPDNIKVEGKLLQSIKSAEARVTWQNCNSTTYTLEDAQNGAYTVSPLPDQSTPGITILFARQAPGSAAIVRGNVAGETIATLSTPAPDAEAIQAEISLLETTASTDGQTVRIGISILNTGKKNFQLTPDDVALVSEDGTTSKPVHSEPALPQTIKRGATDTLYFTFARPSSPTATLKVLDVEYDIEGY